jgi:hypothetical protein
MHFILKMQSKHGTGGQKMANEQRLIDANVLLEIVQYRLPIDSPIGEAIAGCVDITRRTIENAPTVDGDGDDADKRCDEFKYRTDYTEVVRCKDCKHYDKENFYCGLLGINCMVNDFCSYGERRNDGSEA